MKNRMVIIFVFMALIIASQPLYALEEVGSQYKRNNKLSELIDREGFKFGLSQQELITEYGLQKDEIPINATFKKGDSSPKNPRNVGFYYAHYTGWGDHGWGNYDLYKCILIEKDNISLKYVVEAFIKKFGKEGLVYPETAGYHIRHHDRYISFGIQTMSTIPNQTSPANALVYMVHDSTDYTNEMKRRRKIFNKDGTPKQQKR